VVLVVALVNAFADHNKEVEDASKKIDALNQAYEGLTATINTYNNEAAQIAQSQGAAESEVLKIRLAGINKLIDVNRKLEDEKRVAINRAVKNGAVEKSLVEEVNKTVQEGFKLYSDRRILEAQITAQVKKENEDRLKKEEDLNKKRLEALEAAKKKEKDLRDKQTKEELDALAVKVAAQLKALNTEEDQLRIHFENEQDIIERDRAEKEAINAKWDALRLEMQQSFQKSAQMAIDETARKEDELQAKRIKNVQNLLSVASQVADFYSQLSALATEQDNQRIAEQRRQLQSLMDAGALTEKEARIRTIQIEQTEKAARQRAAQREKQAAVFKALLAIPQAFLQGLSQGGYVLAAIYAALAAASAAVVIARPVPKFFRGKKDKYEGPGMVADMGSEIVERGGRMYLYTKPTQTYLGANDKVYTAAETRNIMHSTNINTTVKPQPAAGFDYERLGKSIPKDSVVVNIEKDFISEAVASGLAKNNYFNKRYQFKK